MDQTGPTSTVGAHESVGTPEGFPQEPFQEISETVSTMGSQLGEYLSQEKLRVQASSKKFLLILGAIPVLLLLLATLFTIAWVLVCYGATEVLAQALGGKTWLAALMVGGSIIVLVLLAGLLLWQRTLGRVKKAKARANRARLALRQSFHDTEDSVKKLGSLTAWTERYPIPVTGVAMLAGFTLSGPLTGRSPPAAGTAGSAAATAGEPSPVFDRMQVWATLITTGADILKEVLTPLLQEMVQPKKAKQN